MKSLAHRLNILNIWVDPVNMEHALQRVQEFLQEDRRLPRIIYAANPEKNFSVPRNADLYRAFREADLLIPDGIGIVLAARILHRANVSRVPGVDLQAQICAMAAKEGYRIFVYGGKEEVNRRAVDVLRQRYPGINIVGRANGYIEEKEMDELIDQINRSRAEILFVALGSPKQEMWISAHKGALKTVRVCQGIGGTLDTIAGNVKRAPKIWRRFWLEWLYRLLSEPSRIKRQRKLPVFAFQVIFWKFRGMLPSFE